MSTLDRLVAEKVMGWVPMRVRDPSGIVNNGEYFVNYVDSSGRGQYAEGKWSPSTDMNAAMEVVAHLKPKHDGRFELAATVDGTWEAFFGEWYQGTVDHANPATAICLAALAAVGVEYKESKDE